VQNDPTLVADLESLVDPVTRGDDGRAGLAASVAEQVQVGVASVVADAHVVTAAVGTAGVAAEAARVGVPSAASRERLPADADQSKCKPDRADAQEISHLNFHQVLVARLQFGISVAEGVCGSVHASRGWIAAERGSGGGEPPIEHAAPTVDEECD
jgi:hypothetical protein